MKGWPSVRTKATYSVFGDGASLTAERVTRALGIEPTRSRESGDLAAGNRRTAGRSRWLLETAGPEDRVELSTQLEKLLAVLEPRSDKLWELSALGYEADWWCYVGSHAMEHAAELSRSLMSRLLSVPGELLLDFYEDSPEEH